MKIMTQYKKAWGEDRAKFMREYPSCSKLTASIRSILNLKIIYRSRNNRNKTRQLRKLFQTAKVNNQGHGTFFYSLDEKCVPLRTGRVIENMPLNYGIIVDHSLDELRLRNESSDSNIARQNIETIDVIVNYINQILPGIDNETARKSIAGIIDKEAESLEDALQRILFFNQLLWQSKHVLMGFGRIDKILDRFHVTENSKRIIKDFLCTLHEFYNFKSNVLLGDTGQIFILGGQEEDGTYFANEYTYLFIECIQDLRIPDPKVLLRASVNMPDDLLRTAAQCIATGVGSPLISNDDVIIPALIDFGYTREDAYQYGTSACWEPLVIGKSLEQNNIASIGYGRAIHLTCSDVKLTKCKSFEELKELYFEYLYEEVRVAEDKIDKINWEYDPLLTLFTEGCIDKDLDISRGGAIYNDYGLLSEGISSAVNSLLNLKRFCFDSKKISLKTVRECISGNYSGHEDVKELFSKNADGFGTDSDEAIELTNQIIQKTIDFVQGYRNRFGGKVKFGFSSPNYLKVGQKTGATADGRPGGIPFGTHISREKGEPITEIANFASRLDYKGTNSNANVIDIIIQPNIIIDHIEKFVQYIKSIIKEGIFQIQFNVLSYQKLLDAKAHPEKYPSLIVRVWGFSAYFKDLPEDYQDLLIKRAREMEMA